MFRGRLQIRYHRRLVWDFATFSPVAIGVCQKSQVVDLTQDRSSGRLGTSESFWHARGPSEDRNLYVWARSEVATMESLGKRFSSSFNVGRVAVIAEYRKVTQVLIWAQIGVARGRRGSQQSEVDGGDDVHTAGQ
jgi:hypothetical protein